MTTNEETVSGRAEAIRGRTSSERIRRVGALCAAAILGGTIGLVGLLAVTSMQNRGRLTRLEPEVFHANKLKWQKSGPTDYRLSVRVTGRQAAEYSVEVRGGRVTSATRDRQPLRQQRTFGTWSVPGMFGTMRSDVTNLEKHRHGTADRATPQVLLRARFHERFGYPERYHRTELRKWGTNTEVSWEVTSFEVVESKPER